MLMYRQQSERITTQERRRGSLQRISTNDEAIRLLRDRHKASVDLNNLLQKAMGDTRVADTYQTFRVRYLRALGKFRPEEYEETEELLNDEEGTKAYLKKLRQEQKERKERCSELQNAWLLYDTLATDKPSILGPKELKIEEEMDQFEHDIFEEWHDFCEEVIARAEFDGDVNDPEYDDWHFELKEIRKDLKLIKRRRDERTEMREQELKRVRDMIRLRRGDDEVSCENDNEREEEEAEEEDVDENGGDSDDESSDGKQSKLSSKSSKSTKKSMDTRGINEDEGGDGMKSKLESKASKAKKKKRKEAKSEKSAELGQTLHSHESYLDTAESTRSSKRSKKKKDKNKKSGKKRDKPKRSDQQDKLLEEVFPPHIAKALREGRKVEPESKECVTIFFSDIVGFTNISSSLSPLKVSDMLDRLYQKFDALSHEHDVFKVETIGDR